MTSAASPIYKFREALMAATLLLLLSWGLVGLGVAWGKSYVPPGDGLASARAVVDQDLFRFDSVYYLSIVKNGYSFNGDLGSSPNIVFAPMFPLLVRGVVELAGVEPVLAGMILNKILFWLALAFLFLTLAPSIGRRHAFFVLLAMATAPGSYAFHAFYSESTMLFFLSLGLLSYKKGWWALLALSGVGLGASRLTAFPMVAVFALALGWQALRCRKNLACALWLSMGAVVSVSGTAAYLAFIQWRFGDPTLLLPQIQAASWGLFHQPVTVLGLISGDYLFNYWSLAVARGFSGWMDIKDINLFWTSLAALSAIYALFRGRPRFFSYVFLSYFLFIYCTNSGSDYLISAHRFFAIMLPIYILFAELHAWLALRFSGALAVMVSALLLLINAAYGMAMAGYFNQGVWYFF